MLRLMRLIITVFSYCGVINLMVDCSAPGQVHDNLGRMYRASDIIIGNSKLIDNLKESVLENA